MARNNDISARDIEQMTIQIRTHNNEIIELMLATKDIPRILSELETMKVDVKEHAKNIYDIRIELSELGIVKRLVFAAVGFILLQVMTSFAAALIWFLAQK